MTGRRPLVVFAALLALPLPACLHISTSAPTPTPITTPEQAAKIAEEAKGKLVPAPPKMEFATLPKVPGTVVPTKPNAPPPAPPANTITQKPTAPPVAAPTPPVQPLVAVEPNPLPFAQPAPLPEAPLLAAVRAYTEGRPERAIEIIRTLDRPNQDLVLALMPILARGASADLANDPATAAALVEQLRAAAARLEPRAALRIEKVAFCKEVSGFGRFTPWPDNQPYRPNAQAQLYLEVRNLGSQPTGAEFVTHVHAAVEVRDAHGNLVEQIDPDDYRRRVPVVKFEKRLPSHSPLHDFHVLYVFSVPPVPGVYTVTVELRDAAGRRTVTTQPAKFYVAGP
jgi:hypothetical protein